MTDEITLWFVSHITHSCGGAILSKEASWIPFKKKVSIVRLLMLEENPSDVISMILQVGSTIEHSPDAQ